MKTVNKQQLVILMLLGIPITLTIVATTTAQQALAKNGNSRGQIDASHYTQGLNDNDVPSMVQASGQPTSL